jgi:hypothetical protein
MKYTTKEQFLEMAYAQAREKQANADRRRRLEGRLEEKTLNIVESALSSKVAYNLTPKGLIKADWVDLNIKYKNLHIFNNNTIGISEYDENRYRVILVIKATYCKALRVEMDSIRGQRLNLEDLKALEVQGIAKEYKRLSEALGL